ncbi:DNRLRE domain-containing protein [Solirubrobacter phytolaccae]|uniref:DNRLRE domain-containing protein n=1 Tax=Solirubrobacter phytolaccae TaxID=1404360 RepID=A0A9X3S8U3_9ACTN|nr:DNRLRE domain-containing protein [Solirubrobacter phytolaccae]MDA0180771.1 DNRLRE domain-containing protein [Solirubrobacter phytolaccae]
MTAAALAAIGGTTAFAGVAQATTVDVPVTEDCSLYANSGSTSFCTDTTLNVGRNFGVAGNAIHSVLQFDVAAYVPDGYHVESATLKLKFIDQGESESWATVHRLTSSFDGNATWNTRDGVTAWTTGGGDFGSAEDENYISSIDLPDWADWDVTAMAADWAAGVVPNNGLALVSPWPGVLAATFAASEDGPSTAPYIELTYEADTA